MRKFCYFVAAVAVAASAFGITGSAHSYVAGCIDSPVAGAHAVPRACNG